jgi:hypothetical protein
MADYTKRKLPNENYGLNAVTGILEALTKLDMAFWGCMPSNHLAYCLLWKRQIAKDSIANKFENRGAELDKTDPRRCSSQLGLR